MKTLHALIFILVWSNAATAGTDLPTGTLSVRRDLGSEQLLIDIDNRGAEPICIDSAMLNPAYSRISLYKSNGEMVRLAEIIDAPARGTKGHLFESQYSIIPAKEVSHFPVSRHSFVDLKGHVKFELNIEYFRCEQLIGAARKGRSEAVLPTYLHSEGWIELSP